jgi:8-oxo-dGTP pyrophosphatase MutT (NUDIX family)
MTQHTGRFTMPVAVHVFLLRGPRVLLLRRFQTGYEDGNYSVVAGHLDGGEDVLAAAAREATEEAGVIIDLAHARVVGVMHRRSRVERIDFFVAVDRWTGEITNREPHKCDDLSWHDVDTLPGNVIPYVRRALRNYRDARWFDTFGVANERSRQ